MKYKSFSAILICFVLILSLTLSCFAYDDTRNTGLSFVVPYGWEQAEFSTPKEYFSVKFSPGNKSVFFMYGSKDLYQQLLDNGISGLKRADVNNEYAEKEGLYDGFAEGLGMDSQSMSAVSYSGLMFREIKKSENTYYDLCIHNGYMFMFMFYSPSFDVKSYSDYRGVLNSISISDTPSYNEISSRQYSYSIKMKRIAEEERNNATSTKNDSYSDTEETTTVHIDENNNLKWLPIIVGVIITAIIVLIPIVIHKSAKSRKSALRESDKYETETEKINGFCRKCGEPLFDDSEFCHKCGAEVKRR